jgi:DNA polymerase-3 subunit beta
MEFNVSSAELLKGMMDVSKAVPVKTALPILEYFLFVLNGDKLEITASDQELTLRTVVKVDSKEDGSLTAPAGQLIALFKALPDQPVTIRTTGA